MPDTGRSPIHEPNLLHEDCPLADVVSKVLACSFGKQELRTALKQVYPGNDFGSANPIILFLWGLQIDGFPYAWDVIRVVLEGNSPLASLRGTAIGMDSFNEDV